MLSLHAFDRSKIMVLLYFLVINSARSATTTRHLPVSWTQVLRLDELLLISYVFI